MVKITRYEGDYDIFPGFTIQLNTSTSVTDVLAPIGYSYDVSEGRNRVEEKTFSLKCVFLDMEEAKRAFLLLSGDTESGSFGRLYCKNVVTNAEYYLYCKTMAVSAPEYYNGEKIKITITFYCDFPYWIKEFMVQGIHGQDTEFVATRRFFIDFRLQTQPYRLSFRLTSRYETGVEYAGDVTLYIDIATRAEKFEIHSRYITKTLSCGYKGYRFPQGSEYDIFDIFPAQAYRISAFAAESVSPSRDIHSIMNMEICEMYEVPI
jgi:hypothetical protein